MKSLYRNYAFNIVKTICNIGFPIITFMYASRTLGVEGLGKINFAKSIVAVFAMIATLGTNQYGTREAARIRDNREELSKFSKEILIINIITTFIAYALLIILVFVNTKLHDYESIILILSASVFLSAMGMEWLYQATEEYEYITKKAIAFQILSVVALLTFVKSSEDIVPYSIIYVVSTWGSYVLNFYNARKHIDLKSVKKIEIRKHVSPILWLFAMTVSVELYTVLDSTMLGFLCDDKAVGLYNAAIKVNKLTISLITALGVVLIPRLSYYYANERMENFYILVKKGYNYVFLLAIPCAIGIFCFSNELIVIFSGEDYYSAGFTMKILAIIVLVIPFSVMTNNQTLIPMGKEKLVMMSTSVGAVVNLISNTIFIPRYSENGAAIGTIIAELCVAFVCYSNARRFFDVEIIYEKIYQYILASLPILVIKKILDTLGFISIVKVVVAVTISVIMYILILILLDNPYMKFIFEKVFKRKFD